MTGSKELLIQMNSNTPIGAEHEPNAPYNEQSVFECNVCGRDMDSDKGVCSNICFKADQQ